MAEVVSSPSSPSPSTEIISDDVTCPVCTKLVTKYEKVEVSGIGYHVVDCFRCGLGSNVGCGKSLHRDNFLEQLGKPFCNKCFSKYFLIGFGLPQSGNQDLLSAIETITCSPSKVISNDTNAATTNDATTNDAVSVEQVSIVTNNSNESTKQDSTGQFKMTAVDTPEKVEVAKGSTAAKVAAFSPTGKKDVKKCRNCLKTVYPAELCMAAGASWHKTCFTCGFLPEGEEDPHNGNGQGCGRVLPQDKIHLSCGIAFCNACFTKVFTSGAARGTVLRKKTTNVARQFNDTVDETDVQELDGFMAGSVFQEKKELKVKNIGSLQGDKCPKCSKTVYKMEALLAIGQTWHKSCFTCGGPGNADNLGCERSLPQDSFQQHKMLPYCKACFMKNFGKGNYKASSSNTNVPSKNIVIDTTGGLSFAEKAAAFKKKVHEGTDIASPTRDPRKKVSVGGGGSKCPVCSKTVFKMEEVLAIGNSFHPTCFTCGALGDGSSKEGCGKVLTRDQYLDGQGRIFCKNCYNKIFSNKGLQPSA